MAKKMHFVLLSDVIGSRNIEQRKKFEKGLAKAVEEVNIKFADAFALPARSWKGLDEVAAMLKKPEAVYGVMEVLNTAIAPEQMRFVLVKSEVDIKPANNDITQADGPAFHKAAAMMVKLKADGLWFDCDTISEAFDTGWKTGVNLVRLIKQRWTSQQLMIYTCYRQTGSQEAVAKKMKITQQAVSKALRAITALQVSKLEEDLLRWAQTELSIK